MGKTKNKKEVYLVADPRPWNKSVFKEKILKYPGRWYFVSNPDELTITKK